MHTNHFPRRCHSRRDAVTHAVIKGTNQFRDVFLFIHIRIRCVTQGQGEGHLYASSDKNKGNEFCSHCHPRLEIAPLRPPNTKRILNTPNNATNSPFRHLQRMHWNFIHKPRPTTITTLQFNTSQQRSSNATMVAVRCPDNKTHRIVILGRSPNSMHVTSTSTNSHTLKIPHVCGRSRCNSFWTYKLGETQQTTAQCNSHMVNKKTYKTIWRRAKISHRNTTKHNTTISSHHHRWIRWIDVCQPYGGHLSIWVGGYEERENPH